MICPLNIHPNGQFSAYEQRPLWEPSADVFKHMWEGRHGKNIEILDKNRKQQHVMSICTISVLAPDFLTLPGWLCVPAKSIHLSLPECASSRERTKTGTHSRRSHAKWKRSGESGENIKTHRKEMNHTFPQLSLNNCYLFNNFKWLKLSVSFWR